MKKLEVSILCGLIIAILLSFTGIKIFAFDQNCSGIREKILRLHILANSDSKEDQTLKLKVRDAILKEGSLDFDEESRSNVKALCEKNLPTLKSIAEKEIASNGYDYPVKVYIDHRYFNVREYEEVSMPSGYYDALVVEIGEAKGKNWWCVMFPPLCIPSSTDSNVTTNDEELSKTLNQDEVEIITEKKYKFKLKSVEIWDELKHFFSSK